MFSTCTYKTAMANMSDALNFISAFDLLQWQCYHISFMLIIHDIIKGAKLQDKNALKSRNLKDVHFLFK